MQRFVNNWSATLQAPLLASDLELVVEPDKGTRLILGAGDYVDLTCDPTGAAPEIVRVVGAAGGVLSIGARGREGTPTPITWAAGTVVRCTVTAGYAEPLQARAAVGSADPLPLAVVAQPGAAVAASREDHQHPAPAPGDIGAATAAQGVLAESAVQPSELSAALGAKVDKEAGKGLSSNDFTSAEKSKLAGLESSHFKGLHVSLATLEIAHPTGSAGDYADVDPGAGSAVRRYIWDVSDSQWQQQAGSGGSMTAAEVKSAYESNPDTNAYTDAEQAKLAGVAAGATANANTDSLAEGAANKYFTESRVRSAVLTGLSLLTGGAIAAADTLLVALGKLQNQISGKQDALVSGTTLKTVNGQSLLGAGNLAVSAVVATQSASSSGGVLDLSAVTAQVVLVTLTENITSISLPPGQLAKSVELRIRFTQGATDYTVSGWPTLSVEGGGSPPAMATGAATVKNYVLANDNNQGWTMFV